MSTDYGIIKYIQSIFRYPKMTTTAANDPLIDLSGAPNDVLIEIFLHVPNDDLVHCSMVCLLFVKMLLDCKVIDLQKMEQHNYESSFLVTKM